MKASSTGTSRIVLFSFAAVFLVASSMLYSFAAGDGTPVTPNNFYGTLTINSNPAPVGTRMKGMVGGQDRTMPSPYTTATSGQYGSPGLDGKFGVNCTVGEPIYFEIEKSPGSGNFFVTWQVASCNPGDDTNMNIAISFSETCTNGQTMPCPLQSGVCTGSQETCTGGNWPGCTAANYGPNYQNPETSCDGLDNDCDGQVDEGLKTTYYQDNDNDLYGNPSASQSACTKPQGYVTDHTDCNDGDAGIHPGTAEIKCDGIDQDCSGADNTGTDNDADTYKIDGGLCGLVDCNDGNSQIYPGANEVCDGVDNDCDGTVDEGCACTNGDTRPCPLQLGVCAGSFETCTGNQWPGCTYGPNYQNPETSCDGLDNDCDGLIDEGLKTTYYQDNDNDLYGNPSVSQSACTKPQGYVTDNTDCNDGDAGIHPGAAEIKCDGIDQDCSGADNTGTDSDQDTYKIDGGLCGPIDCNDANAGVNPGASEICNGIDDDCDGETDEGCQQQEYCMHITGMRVLNSTQQEDYTIPAGTMYYIEMSTYNNCDKDVETMQIIQVLKSLMPVNLGSLTSTIHAAETSKITVGFIMPNGTSPGTGFTAKGFNWNHWIDQSPGTFEILSGTIEVAFASE